MPKTKEELSWIAKKAVATRKLNELAKAKKRSDAAKKAWKTRRRNVKKKPKLK